MNTSNFKKPHFPIIAAVILMLALFVGGFWRFKQQKELTRQETINACLESLETSPLEDIAKLISIQSGIKEQDLFSRYLRCRFPWFALAKFAERYGFLLELAGLSEATRRDFGEEAKSKISKISDDKDNIRFPLGYLLLPEIPPDIICRNGILDEDLAIVIKGDLLITSPFYSQENIKIFFDNICSLLFRYSNDLDLFDAEIIKKNVWPSDFYERRFAYRQNLILSVRFVGENIDEVPIFCRTLPEREEVVDCQNHWLSFSESRNLLRSKEMMKVAPSLQECNKILINLEQEICAR